MLMGMPAGGAKPQEARVARSEGHRSDEVAKGVWGNGGSEAAPIRDAKRRSYSGQKAVGSPRVASRAAMSIETATLT